MSGVSFRIRGDLDDDGPEAAVLWSHGCRGIVQEGEDLVGYFDERVDLPLAGCWESVPDVDYLADYYRALQPVDLGPLVVAPTHRTVTLEAPQKVLWLDPGMAFGTGHHATTRLALEALTRLDLAGRSLLDLGAGSGILAVAADLLGAAEARGLDSDAATVPIARANAALNRSRATFEVGSLGDPVAPAPAPTRVDVLVANLYAELHRDLLDAYLCAVAPGGRLLLSGILASRATQVTTPLDERGVPFERRRAGEWLLLDVLVPDRG